MATVREGNKSVLMVVDVQVQVVRDVPQASEKIAKVARAVERARAAGAPVIWVQHQDDELQADSPGWQWVPELVPAANELRVHKHFNSAFEQTNLDAELARLNASHIVLAGAKSNWCIRASAFGAMERGYDLTLLKDAHMTSTLELGDGRTLDAEHLMTDLNVAITWLEYPGRKNTTASAEEVAFGV